MKLIKDIALLMALILMVCRWLFTIMNERKKAEMRENENIVENSGVVGNNEVIENNDIEEVVEELE